MILDILAAQKTAKVSMLADVLNVSHVTLRKDLNKLEKRRIIKCSHGYASLNGADDICKRIAIYYLVKQRIAKAAARIVEEGETILLESGSCCALFAEELAIEKKNITIITNSVFIANYIGCFTNVKIVLLGGCFMSDSQVAVGPMTSICAQNFFLDKFFLGTDGFIPGYGFTGKDLLRVETALEISKSAKNIFVLTESAKFNRRGTYSLIQFDKLAGVFTDDCISKEAETVLLRNNVMLYKVPVAEEKIKWCKCPGFPPFLYTEKT